MQRGAKCILFIIAAISLQSFSLWAQIPPGQTVGGDSLASDSLQAGDEFWSNLTGGPQNLHYGKLPNGLQIILIQDESLPLVSAELSFRVGSYAEDQTSNGIFYLLEKYLSFKPGLPYRELTEPQKKAIPFKFNSTSTTERTGFSVSMDPASALEGLDLLKLRVISPDFNSISLETLRKELGIEFEQRNTDVFDLFERTLYGKLYLNEAGRRNARGDFQVIYEADKPKLIINLARFFVPENALLTVSGALSPQDLKPMADSVFRDWASWNGDFIVNWDDPAPEELPDTRFTLINENVVKPLMMYGWTGPGAKDNFRDCLIAGLFSRMASHPNSKISKSLIGSGLATSVAFRFRSGYLPEPLLLTVVPAPGQEKRCAEAAILEAQRFSAPDYFQDQELRAAQKQAQTEFLFRKDHPVAFARELSRWWALNGEESWFEALAEIEKIDLDDIRDFTERYLTGKRFAAGLLCDSDFGRDLDAAEFFSLPDNAPLPGMPLAVTDSARDTTASLPDLSSIRIYFRVNSFMPDSASQRQLEKVGEMLSSDPDLNLYIDGHADTQGSAKYNKYLSERRAQAVRKYLIRNHRIPREQLLVRAFGETQPEFEEDSEENLQKNRRVEFTLVKYVEEGT